MLVCANCQFQNIDNAKFCRSCGYKLEGLSAKPESAGNGSSVCPSCGAALKPNVKFCSKCGTAIASPAAPKPEPIPQSAPVPQPEPVPQHAPVNSPVEKEKKKAPVAVICTILVLLLLGGGFFALTKMDVIQNPPSSKDDTDSETVDAKENKNNDEKSTDEQTDETAGEDITAEVKEKLTPIAEQTAAGEEKMNDGDYAGASADFREALNAYAAFASEYDSEGAIAVIDPSATDAFNLYTQSILKQVEGWEAQPPTAPLYQQIDLTMKDAVSFAGQLKEAGLAISADALDADYAAFPGRYKEKYILAFNDLINGDWSRTTAWNNMQDAASVGLVDRNNPDDPLTLRYAYALAWITQKETSEGINDGSVTDADAITSILAVAENADYNPVLMRELALCYDAIGNTGNSKLIKDACVDVSNYLANKESVYINGEELFVPGISAGASSTIPLSDFWYFNDFGEYSDNLLKGGVSKEGRDYIRTRYKQAISSLK